MLRYSNKRSRRPVDKPTAKAELRTPTRPIPQQNQDQDRIETWFDIGVCVVGMGCFALFVASTITSSAPQVGDNLHYTPGFMHPGVISAMVTARETAGPLAPLGTTCTLDEQMLSTPGGTLSVVEVGPRGIGLSWMGGPSSAHQPCPTDGELLVSPSNYQLLSQIQRPHPDYMR